MNDDQHAELCPACTRISWDIQDGECRTCRETPQVRTEPKETPS